MPTGEKAQAGSEVRQLVLSTMAAKVTFKGLPLKLTLKQVWRFCFLTEWLPLVRQSLGCTGACDSPSRQDDIYVCVMVQEAWPREQELHIIKSELDS